MKNIQEGSSVITCWKRWWWIKDNRHLTISDFALIFPDVPRAVIVHDHLASERFEGAECHTCYRKTSERNSNSICFGISDALQRKWQWVPFFNNHRVRNLDFSLRARKKTVVMWVKLPQLSTKPNTGKPLPFRRKLIPLVFWDCFGILLTLCCVKWLNAEYYCKISCKLQRTIQNWWLDSLPTTLYSCMIMQIRMGHVRNVI